MATNLLQKPDPSSWPSVMQAHRGWLTSVIYARLRDGHAVDEVLQETALAASQQKQIASDSEGVCKWLYRVAIRQAMLYRRKQFRAERRVQEVGERSLGNYKQQTEFNDPLQTLVAMENRHLVRAAMNQLDTKDCEILMLKYCDGWSCQEMASRLEVSLSAVKSRLLRARRSLRDKLLTLDSDWETS